jgi:hypothetical protein
MWLQGITVNLPGSGKWGLGWMQAINQSTQVGQGWESGPARAVHWACSEVYMVQQEDAPCKWVSILVAALM